MDMKVHCPGCTKSLRVPKTSSGRKARCPNCQKVFTVPKAEDLVDETISTWIEDDLERLEVEHEKQWEAIGSIKAYQRPKPASGTGPGSPQPPLRHDSAKNQQAQTSSVSAEAQQHATSDPSTILAIDDLKPIAGKSRGDTIEVSAATSGKPAITASGHAAAASVGGMSRGFSASDPIDQPYPNSLRVDPMKPYLVVVRCDQAGVCFAFDSVHLENLHFRTSIPVCCTFSGETDRRKLTARPFVFIDRSGARIRSAQEVESKNSTALIAGQSATDLLNVMGTIDALPKPFRFCMPYYSTHEFSHQSLKCWTESRDEMGVTCFVVIPYGAAALQWLLNVNGSCGIEAAKLENDIALLDNDAWRQIGDECRRRLAVWCPFEPMETFRLYLSDSDFGSRDKGLAGIVITDRRLIYCKYHHRGTIDLSLDATLYVRDETDFAQLSIENAEGKTKLIRLHDYDVPVLLEMLEHFPGIKVERKSTVAEATPSA